MFEDDPETELIVMCGEIGGDAEERAAEFIAANVTKPVVAYIAGFTAPPGKTMGHAGAIVSGSRGTAAAKAEALESKGVRVGTDADAGRRTGGRAVARLAPARRPAVGAFCAHSAEDRPTAQLTPARRRSSQRNPVGVCSALRCTSMCSP